MTEKYFEAIANYTGIVAWFIILIAAKLSHVASKKKLTKWQVVANILYALIGGIMAYFGTSTFNGNIRVIAVGFGVLAGDILVAWIPKNADGFFDALGELVKKYLHRKK